MRTKTTIHLDREDMADLRHLAEAFNLVGGATSNEKKQSRDRGVELSVEEQEAKLFGRISANDFTIEDVLSAVMVIKRRRDALYARCDDPVFLDAKLQDVWSTGIQANADHAVRLAEGFLSNLRDDMAA